MGKKYPAHNLRLMAAMLLGLSAWTRLAAGAELPASGFWIEPTCGLPGEAVDLSMMATYDAPLKAFTASISCDPRLTILSVELPRIDGASFLHCAEPPVKVDFFTVEEGDGCLVVGIVIDYTAADRTCPPGNSQKMATIRASISKDAVPGEDLWISLNGECGEIPKSSCLVLSDGEGSRKICPPDLQLEDAAVRVMGPPGMLSYSTSACVGEDVSLEIPSAPGADSYEFEVQRDGGPWDPVCASKEPVCRYRAGQAGAHVFRARAACGPVAGPWATGPEMMVSSPPGGVPSIQYDACVPMDGNIAIVWSPVEGAAEYRVEGRRDGGDWFGVCSTEATSCQYTIPEGAGAHEFRASACNGCGCGAAGLGPSIVSCAVFRRGDTNGDGKVDITDAINVLGFLFQGVEAPECHDAADSDDSGVLDLTDGIFTLTWLFQGGPEPPAPGPKSCGSDNTPQEPGQKPFPLCSYDRDICRP